MAGYRNNSQERILAYIQKHTEEKGYPPSVREICEAVGLKSTSTVHGHLTRLEKRGLLRRDQTKPRAIEVLGKTAKKKTIDIPIVGLVTAGTPILAVENIEDTFPIPVDMFSDAYEHFILNVRGDSMIEAGILDGDQVIVRKQQGAQNRDIVVAMIEEEATVKRFFREHGHIRLQPENSSMEPIIVKDVTILGLVVGLYRVF
jgi:repressor LexA